jgi:tRNA (guanine37-N1)-methyltransferase
MIMEAVARLVPGFMGKAESGDEESFSQGLLEYPHYTRPDLFEGVSVPEVLRCGDHAKTSAWRRGRSLEATLRLRPELLEEAELGEGDADFLRALPRERPGRNLYLCLVHYPVLLKTKNPGASSLTNLDIHDIARSSCGYGLGGLYVSTPLPDQAQILRDILRYWMQGAGSASNPDRARALSLVRHVPEIADAVADIEKSTGQRPLVLGSSAQWRKSPVYTPEMAREALAARPVLLLLGTSHGLAPDALAACDGQLRPLRFLDAYRHLSVRAAVAAYVDRILNDFY